MKISFWQKCLLVVRLTLTAIALIYIASTVQRLSELAKRLGAES